ncbi:MAG: ATP-binding protein [Actinobacteria bacterium]|nr:MAG: ATP-binding protein [Actinomycetota bacterium]
MKKNELVIKADMKNLGKVREFIELVASESNFDESSIFDMKVAVCEAVSNAIDHGSPKGRSNDVTVTISFEEGKLTIKVADQGSFKPAVPIDDPSFHHRGRGIPFMLALMDEVTINEGKEGTVVRLVKKLKKVKKL